MILPVERVAENDKGAQRSGALGAPGPGSRVPGPGVRGPGAGSRVPGPRARGPGPRAPGPGPGHRHTETDTDTASPVAHLRPLLRAHSDTHRHTAADISRRSHSETKTLRHSYPHTETHTYTDMVSPVAHLYPLLSAHRDPRANIHRQAETDTVIQRYTRSEPHTAKLEGTDAAHAYTETQCAAHVLLFLLSLVPP